MFFGLETSLECFVGAMLLGVRVGLNPRLKVGGLRGLVRLKHLRADIVPGWVAVGVATDHWRDACHKGTDGLTTDRPGNAIHRGDRRSRRDTRAIASLSE